MHEQVLVSSFIAHASLTPGCFFISDHLFMGLSDVVVAFHQRILENGWVISEISDRTEDLERLCRRFRVTRLEVFGSASTGRFDARNSDLDFLVEFEAMQPKAHADAYFGLLAGLEELFSRNVDLIEPEAINNPYFRESVDESRTPLYAA